MRWPAALLAVPLFADVGLERETRVHLVLHYSKDGSSTRTRVLGLDVAARRIRWALETTDVFEVNPLRIRNRLILPRSRDRMVEHYEDGRLLRRISTARFRRHLPLSEDEYVESTYDLELYRRRHSGETVWKIQLPSEGRDLWRLGDRLIVPTYVDVRCFELSSGKELWVHELGGQCLYGRLYENRFYAWDWWKGGIVCLDPESGKKIWDAPIVRPWITAIERNRIIVFRDYRVAVLDASTGAEAWKSDDPALPMALKSDDELKYTPFVPGVVLGKAAYFSTGQGIVARDFASGAKLKEIDLRETVVGLAAAPTCLVVALQKKLVLISPSGTRLAEIPLDVQVEFMRRVDQFNFANIR